MRFLRVLKRRYQLAGPAARRLVANRVAALRRLKILTSRAVEGHRYFYLGPDVALTRLKSGHMLYVDPQDESVSAHLIAHGFWEEWVHSVLRSLVSPGDRVIDVGANLGYYTVALARSVGVDGSVIALEANGRLAALVQRSVDFNGYTDIVRVIPKAASDQPGIVSFMTSRRNSGSGHTRVAESSMGGDVVAVEVDTVRLDDLEMETADLIRIDAEGSEALVLRGATRLLQNPNIVICMEWSVVQMRSRSSVPEFIDWLSSMGFQFWKIEETATLTPVPAEKMTKLGHCDVVVSRTPPRVR